MTVTPTLSSVPAPDSTSQVANPNQTLGQSDFLKLLVTQLTAQDPLNPQSGTDFVAQLAQFSALQNSQTMSSDISTLQANGLIGRTVIVNAPDGTQLSGVVSGVTIQAGTPQLVVNGQSYDLSQVSAIIPTPVPTTPG